MNIEEIIFIVKTLYSGLVDEELDLLSVHLQPSGAIVSVNVIICKLYLLVHKTSLEKNHYFIYEHGDNLTYHFVISSYECGL